MSDSSGGTTKARGNPAQAPRILSVLLSSMAFIVTLSCPLLFHYQARLQCATPVGELVHGAHHHFCRDNRLQHPAAGEH